MDLRYKEIQYCAGVGSKRADLIRRELNIEKAIDLLYLFPYKYIDRSRFYSIREISESETYVQIIGRIVSMQTIGAGKGKRLSAQFADRNGDQIELVWFKGVEYLHLQIGVEYLLFGKPTAFNHVINIVHPELELLSRVDLDNRKGLEPHYNTSEKMKSGSLTDKAMRKIMEGLMADVREGISDTLPQALREKYHLVDLTTALLNIHFPQNQQMLQKAKERLKFEELFYIQLQILLQSHRHMVPGGGYKMPLVGHYFNTFYFHHLPFPLTGAQKRVVKEIQADLKSGEQMNRLLQGDVGSGKTLVALLCALLAADNGYQTCIMAPTEILANQHFDTLTAMLSSPVNAPSNIPENLQMPRVALLTGSTTKKQRESLFPAIRSGEVQIIVGTHALLEDNVEFGNLGLVVVDEQHRFGVAQRAKLWAKNERPPHVLVMTATPIPRTLAMTLYGDLSVSQIDELPPGRKAIQTLHQTEMNRMWVNQFMHKQIEAGRQVYVVYPLIMENKKLNLADLENGYERLVRTFPNYRISRVHGQMKAKDKDFEMRRFASGETQILVATTVIEVGVNVPNASVMVVENAERFGLSQLHQLRGRVGRGAEQSYCILITGVEQSKDTRKRMDIMVATNDGFRIAEADLQLRGPGDLEGTAQSGLPFELKIASLATDGQILELARHEALEIIEDDPTLQMEKNQFYVYQLSRLKPREVHDWSEIS